MTTRTKTKPVGHLKINNVVVTRLCTGEIREWPVVDVKPWDKADDLDRQNRTRGTWTAVRYSYEEPAPDGKTVTVTTQEIPYLSDEQIEVKA